MTEDTPLASRVAQRVSGPSSSCVWNPRVFADDARVSEPRSWALEGIPGAGRAGLTWSGPPAGVLQQAAGARRGLHQCGHLGVWYEGRRG